MTKLNAKRIIKQSSKINSRLQKQRDTFYRLQQKYYKKREQAERYGISIGESIKTPKVITKGSINKLQESISALEDRIKIEKTDVVKTYNKRYKNLMRNINKVVEEGYAINVKIPQKPINVTPQSIRRLEEINKKVLEESTIYDKSTGKELTRKQYQNKKRIKNARMRKYDNKMKQGKVLTQKEQADYVSTVFNFGELETFSRDNVVIHSLVKSLEGTYLRIESQYNGSKDGSLLPYVRDWRTRTYQWLQENKDNIAGLKRAIRAADMSNLDITVYDSDDVGISPFLVNFEMELSSMIGRTPNMTPLPEEYQDEAYRALQEWGGDEI